MSRPGAAKSLRTVTSAAHPAPLRPRPRTHHANRAGGQHHLHSSVPSPSAAAGPAATMPEAVPLRRPDAAPVQRTTVATLAALRAAKGPLVAGTAAYSDSDMFKTPGALAHDRPRARRWDQLLSGESAARQPCVLKQAAARHLRKPGLISLGGGIPHPANFPFASLSFDVADAPGEDGAATAGGLASLSVPKHGDPAAGVEYDLATALNYGQANGSAQMLRFVTEHTELVCAPPYRDWRCALTVGSTGALEQALRMVCDASRGDAVLTEEFSFATAVETAAPLGVPVVGVPMDGEGLLPEAMERLLRDWDPAARRGAPRPRVLYTVPSGQNPTGATQGEQRRRDIYDVCRRFDVYVLEDEPYYFLQMPPYAGRQGQGTPKEKEEKEGGEGEQTVDEFLAGLIPSLLSMDVDGRVMRMDSFSKVVVPGSRLGWITASEQMVERYIRHGEVCNQGPSGFSQVILHRLLDRHWGHDGYLRWLMRLRLEYTRRRDVMLAACEDYLPRDVVSWNPPAAGMFVSFFPLHALSYLSFSHSQSAK